MDTEAIVDVVTGVPIAWPRLESDAFLMTTGSARPLEDAFRIAHQQMVLWVAELTGLSELDAYQLVSQVALTPVANVVDTNYTVVAKVPKPSSAVRPRWAACTTGCGRGRRPGAATRDGERLTWPG